MTINKRLELIEQRAAAKAGAKGYRFITEFPGNPPVSGSLGPDATEDVKIEVRYGKPIKVYAGVDLDEI